MDNLEKSVLATIVYYDVIERPLTRFEVFKYLINPVRNNQNQNKPTLNKIIELLEKSAELNQFIGQQNGFYFLKNRTDLVGQRLEKQKLSDQKWKKAKKIIRTLQAVPYLRVVIVSGSLALNNPRSESDIDLLIIAQQGRIWTCRALTTLFFGLIGKYRRGSLTKDRFCPNHYLTDRSLEITFRSLYNAQTYTHLTPVWQASPDLYSRFQETNQWLRDYLIFYPESQTGYLKEIKSSRLFNLIRKIQEFILDSQLGNGLEFILKRIQQNRIKKDRLTYQPGGRVVFNDQQLEFHPVSPEKNIIEKYNQKMKQLGFPEMAQERDSGLTI